MDQDRGTKVRSRNVLVMLIALFLSPLSAPAWAHEEGHGHASTVSNVPQQVPASTSHLHEGSVINICPQLEDETDTAGLRHCVTTLSNQISEFLRLIMNLSEALAESQNELMRGSPDQQGRSIPRRTVPQS